MDIYKQMASKTFGVPYDEVTPRQRSIIKSHAWSMPFNQFRPDVEQIKNMSQFKDEDKK